MIEKIKSKRAGYVIGFFFLFASPVFLLLNYQNIVNNGAYNPYTLYLGVVFVVMGIIFLIFPGSQHRVADYPNGQVRVALLWQYAPRLHQVAWILGTVISVVACLQVEANLPFLVSP